MPCFLFYLFLQFYCNIQGIPGRLLNPGLVRSTYFTFNYNLEELNSIVKHFFRDKYVIPMHVHATLNYMFCFYIYRFTEIKTKAQDSDSTRQNLRYFFGLKDTVLSK